MPSTYDIQETSVGNAADQHKRDVWSTLVKVRRQNYPFVTFLMDLPKRKVKNRTYELYEMGEHAVRFTLNGALTAGTLSITLKDSDGTAATQQLVVDDLLLIDSEIIRVTTATGSTTAGISRAAAGSTAAAHANAAYVLKIGSALAENGSARAATSIQSSAVSNYTQIFSETYGVTWREQNTQHYDGDPMENNAAAKMALFKATLNNAMWHGKKYTPGSTNPRTMTGGFFEFATSNVYDLTNRQGILTLGQFCDIVFSVGEYGSPDKVVYCGKNMLNMVQNWFMRPELLVNKLEKSGLTINYQTINYLGRSVKFVYEPAFEDAFAGYAAIVDHKYVRMAEFMPITIKKDVQDNDEILITKNCIVADCGFDFSNVKAHGVIKGIANIAGA